ncbi:MAG: anhydro-N-acetylmuramic acid kinase [Verrucomicrobia bacterium]|nr:anhydro-N-acetylmuramic acid kinase [Verrucomicrobiota bacterium]
MPPHTAARFLPAGRLFVLGIMSGTSIDSVDYALCSIDGARVGLEKLWQAQFPRRLRNRLHAAANGQATSHETSQLHHDLGRFYAEEAAQGMGRLRLDVAGLHGQTIFHHPAKPPATFQLGEPAYLVERLRVPVVSNFRAADLAAGGQGAPLATLFHRVVFGQKGEHVCVNNLGGISNVTSIDWRRQSQPRLLAFDTGPGNMLIDLAIRYFTQGRRTFDEDGAWARRGRVSEKLLARYLEHSFFFRRPPKSTGREEFGESFFKNALSEARRFRLSRFDVVATLTELTARSLVLNYRLHLKRAPGRVVLAGGGALNPVLADRIRGLLQRWEPGLQLRTCDRLGWPVQSVEPAAFALLAYYRLRDWPANFPSTTGAMRSVKLGQISEP